MKRKAASGRTAQMDATGSARAPDPHCDSMIVIPIDIIATPPRMRAR